MMNSKQVFAEARHAGMKLWVPKDKDVVKVSTRIPLREEFKEALTAHRDEIMRDLLMAQADSFLQERFLKTNAIPDECKDRVEEAYADGTITELREALRDYVRAGLAEYKAARASREEREKSRSDV